MASSSVPTITTIIEYKGGTAKKTGDDPFHGITFDISGLELPPCTTCDEAHKKQDNYDRHVRTCPVYHAWLKQVTKFRIMSSNTCETCNNKPKYRNHSQDCDHVVVGGFSHVQVSTNDEDRSRYIYFELPTPTNNVDELLSKMEAASTWINENTHESE